MSLVKFIDGFEASGFKARVGSLFQILNSRMKPLLKFGGNTLKQQSIIFNEIHIRSKIVYTVPRKPCISTALKGIKLIQENVERSNWQKAYDTVKQCNSLRVTLDTKWHAISRHGVNHASR